MLSATLTAMKIVSYGNLVLANRIKYDGQYEEKLNEGYYDICFNTDIGIVDKSINVWLDKLKSAGEKNLILRFKDFNSVYIIGEKSGKNWEIKLQLLERDPKTVWRLFVNLTNEIYQDYHVQSIDSLFENAKKEFAELSSYLKKNKFPESESMELARKIISGESQSKYECLYNICAEKRKTLANASFTAWSYGSKYEWYGAEEKEFENCRKKMRSLHQNLVFNIENTVNQD